MVKEERIANKIITIEKIIEIANYLEKQKDEYNRLFEEDKNNNANLSYSEQVHQYQGNKCGVRYTINFKDGREIEEESYNWFMENISILKTIKGINFYLPVSYSSNIKDRNHNEYMNLYVWLFFQEDHITLKVEGTNVEDQVYKLHTAIRGILDSCEERYNKTVKFRKLRIQSFTFSIGFLLSYILYLVLIASKANLGADIVKFLDNKYFLVFGQWAVAAILGNIIGLPIMMSLYRNILPKTKYSHYSTSSHRSVYVDNIEDYVSHNEIQIGEFADNAKKRSLIEKIYKITRIIVLVQVLLSVIFFLTIK